MKFLAWMLLSATALAHPADLWWATEDCFASPERVNNVCSEAQKQGFDWSRMTDEQACDIDGFRFQGFRPKSGCQSSGGKCIQGTLSGYDSALQINAQQEPFSVQKFHLATSVDVDLLITYILADETTCRQTVACSSSGTDVLNDQCGGAVAVTFQLVETYSVRYVDLELLQMEFDCSSGPKLMESFPGAPIDLPAMPAITTEFPGWATEMLPTTSYTASRSTPAPTLSSSPEPESSEVTDCPEVMPKCLNTWLDLPQCDSNSDTACFCPSSEFSTKIKSCIHSWSSSEEERDSALTYFAAICAPYVSTNPGIISLCPTSALVTAVPEPTVSEPPCTTITYSTLTATLPQVCFSTYPAVSTTSVALVTGTPTLTPSQPPVHSTEECTTTADLAITPTSPSETVPSVPSQSTDDCDTELELIEYTTTSTWSHPTLSPSPGVTKDTLPSTKTESPAPAQPTGDCDYTTTLPTHVIASPSLISKAITPSSTNAATTVLAEPAEPCETNLDMVDESPVFTPSPPVVTPSPVVPETLRETPTAVTTMTSDCETSVPTDLEFLEDDDEEDGEAPQSTFLSPATSSKGLGEPTSVTSFVTVPTPATSLTGSSLEGVTAASSSDSSSSSSSYVLTTVPGVTASPTDIGVVYQGVGPKTRAGSVLTFGVVFFVLLLQ